MSWWVLTKLINQTDGTSLLSLSSTNVPDHLFMYWSYHKPARKGIYRRVRGVLKFCGWVYRWDTPNLAEQIEYGDTINHSFYLPALLPDRYIYYLLWAPGGPYGLPIQSALITYWIGVPEAPPYAARVYTYYKYPFDPHAYGWIDHELISYDYGGLRASTFPPFLRATSAGTYVIGCRHTWQPATGGLRRTQIMLYPYTAIATILTEAPPGQYPEPLHRLEVQHPLALADHLWIQIYHTAGEELGPICEPSEHPTYWMTRIA